MHSNRLQSVGDFALILIHALSHIKVQTIPIAVHSSSLTSTLQVNPEDLSNDYDPKFTTEFYRNMKILSLDLYKKTAALNNSTNPSSTAAATSGAVGGGNFSSSALAHSKSKSNLTASTRKKLQLQQLNMDLPPIADGGKIDFAALALESPTG